MITRHKTEERTYTKDGEFIIRQILISRIKFFGIVIFKKSFDFTGDGLDDKNMPLGFTSNK